VGNEVIADVLFAQLTGTKGILTLPQFSLPKPLGLPEGTWASRSLNGPLSFQLAIGDRVVGVPFPMEQRELPRDAISFLPPDTESLLIVCGGDRCDPLNAPLLPLPYLLREGARVTVAATNQPDHLLGKVRLVHPEMSMGIVQLAGIKRPLRLDGKFASTGGSVSVLIDDRLILSLNHATGSSNRRLEPYSE
jgi:hypothetical protein